jgi:hypothetical protein
VEQEINIRIDRAMIRYILLIAALLQSSFACYSQCGANDQFGCNITGPSVACVGKSVIYRQACEYNFNRYSWTDGNGHSSTTGTFTLTFTTPGEYCIELTAACAREGGGRDEELEECEVHGEQVSYKHVTVYSSPTTPIISTSPATTLCGPQTVVLTVTNSQPGLDYVWTVDGQTVGTGISISRMIENSTSISVAAVVPGESACSASATQLVQVIETEKNPAIESESYHSVLLVASGTANSGAYYWQTSVDGEDTSYPATAAFEASNTGRYFLRRKSGSCWTPAKAIDVSVSTIPPTPEIGVVQYPGYSLMLLANSRKEFIYQFADYFLVSDVTGTETDKPLAPEGNSIYTNSTYIIRGRDRQTGNWGDASSVNVSIRDDESTNSIHTKSYDGISEETAFAESKSYFGEDGRGLQVQTKSHQGKELVVFATGELRDQYDRVVGETLPVLMPTNDFRYNASTRLQEQASMFTVDNSQVGTVGWYYSDSNNRETHVPKTNYPYSRNEYYNDGTNEVRRSTTVGDVLHMGSGMEIVSGTFPVYHELDDYLARRGEALPGIVQSATLKEKGVQNIVRDQNGIYIVTITDKNGNSIMTARKGGTDVGQHSLVINNSVTSTGIPASSDFRKMTYFYILDDQAVALSGSNFYVEDILNDIRKDPGQTFAGPDGMWPAGFYRVILIDESSTVTINYKNYFTDVSYQFYDDAGRLVSSVSPNGVASWMSGAAYGVIDKTTYEYNFRGLVKSMTEVDAGTSRYIYRKDGKIRFSQNALQRENEINNQTTPNKHGKFSYTLYDDIGRPVESGEYIGEDQTYASQGESLEYSAQQSYEDEEKKDWVVTHYDTPDNNFVSTGLGSIYSQNFLRGAVSATENKNIATWYSYDELGRVIWMAQKPRVLQRVFVVKYTYDLLGNVLTTANLAYDLTGNLMQQFYHHYEYDADKRLSRAYTSTEENSSKRLRASYKYYLHGPLKRIELGDNLQGIDFVYNIHGWLTHINHPDPGQDPGGDSNDVFGMVLDYYESDLDGVFSTAINGPDPLRWHKLPELSGANNMLASHQPLIRFDPYSEVEPSGFKQSLFKKYSAENPAYRKMLQTPSTH